MVLAHENLGVLGDVSLIFGGITAEAERLCIQTNWETGMIGFLVFCSLTFLSRKPSCFPILSLLLRPNLCYCTFERVLQLVFSHSASNHIPFLHVFFFCMVCSRSPTLLPFCGVVDFWSDLIFYISVVVRFFFFWGCEWNEACLIEIFVATFLEEKFTRFAFMKGREHPDREKETIKLFGLVMEFKARQRYKDLGHSEFKEADSDPLES